MPAASSHLGQLVALLSSFFVACHAQESRNCGIERLRACGTDFVVYSNTTSIPEDADGLREKCELFTSQVACSLKYVDDCLQGTTRGTLLVTLRAAEEDIEAICTNGTDYRRRYFESVPCMNRKGDALHSCIRNLNLNMQKALDSAPRNKAIHYACCFYGTATDCAESALSDCGPSSPAKEFLIGLWEHVMGDVLSLFCGTHTRGSASCAVLPELPEPAVPLQLKQIVEYGVIFSKLA